MILNRIETAIHDLTSGGGGPQENVKTISGSYSGPGPCKT